MPNFTVRPTAGTDTAVWTDPPTVSTPSRINPYIGKPHLYYQIETTSTVTISATVNGVEGPLDGALGGDLFTTAFVEWPSGGLVTITSPGGQTSVASFTPVEPGHYLVRMRRANGGSLFVHFHAIQP